MLIHNVEQGTEEWFACRLGKLTASVAKTISTAGKGLETLCLEKATEILTGKPNETYKNEAMEQGNLLESEARAIYELETGATVTQVGFVEENEYVGVSPDGLVGEDGLIEIKCPTNKTYTQYLLDGKIKPEYYSQMQMQMFITERLWCDYVVYNPNFKKSITIQRVYPDNEEIKRIADGLAKGTEIIKGIVNDINSKN